MFNKRPRTGISAEQRQEICRSMEQGDNAPLIISAVHNDDDVCAFATSITKNNAIKCAVFNYNFRSGKACYSAESLRILLREVAKFSRNRFEQGEAFTVKINATEYGAVPYLDQFIQEFKNNSMYVTTLMFIEEFTPDKPVLNFFANLSEALPTIDTIKELYFKHKSAATHDAVAKVIAVIPQSTIQKLTLHSINLVSNDQLFTALMNLFANKSSLTSFEYASKKMTDFSAHFVALKQGYLNGCQLRSLDIKTNWTDHSLICLADLIHDENSQLEELALTFHGVNNSSALDAFSEAVHKSTNIKVISLISLNQEFNKKFALSPFEAALEKFHTSLTLDKDNWVDLFHNLTSIPSLRRLQLDIYLTNQLDENSYNTLKEFISGAANLEVFSLTVDVCSINVTALVKSLFFHLPDSLKTLEIVGGIEYVSHAPVHDIKEVEEEFFMWLANVNIKELKLPTGFPIHFTSRSQDIYKCISMNPHIQSFTFENCGINKTLVPHFAVTKQIWAIQQKLLTESFLSQTEAKTLKGLLTSILQIRRENNLHTDELQLPWKLLHSEIAIKISTSSDSSIIEANPNILPMEQQDSFEPREFRL